jgi:hypothetical protein
MVRMMVVLLLLSACAPTPVVVPGSQPPAIWTFPMPLCVVFCTSSISAIREDVNSTGSASITSGAKSNTQTNTSTGGGRSTTVSN